MSESNNIKDLIPIEDRHGRKAVSARMLHAFLESKKDFSSWIKNRISKYGFAENMDYEVFTQLVENPNGGRPQKGHLFLYEELKKHGVLPLVEQNN